MATKQKKSKKDILERITYENMNEKLIEAVPELKEGYKKALKWWGDEKPPVHALYGDLLNPYLLRLLKSGNNEKLLKRIFGFLEILANNKEKLVREVVTVTVCERLLNDKGILKKGREYMGPETLESSKAIEKFWYDHKYIEIKK